MVLIHVNLNVNMLILSIIGKRLCRRALNDSKLFLLPSHLQLQSTVRTLFQSPASEFVKVRRHSDEDSGIIQINMDRPGAKNALGKDIARELLSSFEAISTDSTAKVLIIRSSVSKVFCAGADLKELKATNVSENRVAVNLLRSTFSFLEALQIPTTIAAIEGVALGGELEMALCCDLRICGEDATLGLPETGLAIIPGAGGTQRLPRLVGESIGKELIFTGRKISARDALSIGLVNYCVPAGEAYVKALNVAREINQKGPIAIRMAKQAINQGLEVNMPSALSVEEDCYEQTFNTKDQLEGLVAFAEKRKPVFEGK